MQAFFLMIALCFAVVYWKFALALLGCLIAYGLTRWAIYDYQQREAAERQRIATLIEHADREHQQVQQGDMAGIYGAYPVPDECAGIGIWLCDNQPKGKRRRGAPQRRSGKAAW